MSAASPRLAHCNVALACRAFDRLMPRFRFYPPRVRRLAPRFSFPPAARSSACAALSRAPSMRLSDCAAFSFLLATRSVGLRRVFARAQRVWSACAAFSRVPCAFGRLAPCFHVRPARLVGLRRVSACRAFVGLRRVSTRHALVGSCRALRFRPPRVQSACAAFSRLPAARSTGLRRAFVFACRLFIRACRRRRSATGAGGPRGFRLPSGCRRIPARGRGRLLRTALSAPSGGRTGCPDVFARPRSARSG